MSVEEARDPSGWLIAALGVAQIVAWGSIYYGFALLLEPLQQDLRAPKEWVVGAFSAALLTSGLAAPWIGRTIDRYGGRAVMTIGSIAGVVLLVVLSRVQGLAGLYLAWIGLGLVMSATLYEPAFAVVTQLFHTNYRRAITLLTLFGGFASTVFWPLTTWLMQHLGWRDAVLALAGINLLINVPLFALLPAAAPRRAKDPKDSAVASRTPADTPAVASDPPDTPALASNRPDTLAVACEPPVTPTVAGDPPDTPTVASNPPDRSVVASDPKTLNDLYADPRFYALAFATLASALVIAAMGVHLIAILLSRGLSPASAAVVGALFGPMQVAGRVAELAVSSRLRASEVGRIAVLALPAALLLFLIAGADLVLLAGFSLLYGAGNGAMTIVRGTLPVELYGRTHYGAITGALAMPGLVARAAGPLVAALLWSALGGYDAVIVALALVAILAAAAFYLATAGRLAPAASRRPQ